MPELPEVEVVCLGLAPQVIERQIQKVEWSNKKLRLPVPRANLKQWVEGAQIKKIFRRAKYILLRLDNNAHLIIHLGMTGKLFLVKSSAPRLKHNHLRLFLDTTLEIRFNDTRRFGSIQVVTPQESWQDLFKDLGPEPFGDDFSISYLQKCALNRVQPVKNFLMDSRTVVGIGNIYASEILFCAGVLPSTPSKNLSKVKWKKIVKNSRQVLQKAINAGGTTISDFARSNGESGYFQLDLQVYGRGGKPCQKCSTPITRTVMAGRATYFCPSCQS